MAEVDLQAALPDGYAFRHLAEVDSTNSEAQCWLAAGHAPKALFIANRQTAGRGRRGREWASPLGNLYASLLVPVPADMRTVGHYGFIISLAIHNAIKTIKPDAPVTLKWPNDILVSGAKVSGILIEVAGSGLIIGFGVNLAHAPEPSAYQVTKLDAWIGAWQPQAFCLRVMQQFFRLQDLPVADLLKRWKVHAQGIDAPIAVNLPNESVQGIFRGLAGDGALQLELADGTIRPIYTGDVFFR